MYYRIGDYKSGFTYINEYGKNINNKKILNWIKSLKIPPAYNNVKISKKLNSKILAFGFDSKGRKQVIYNQCFINKRCQEKYNRMFENLDIFNKINKDIIQNLKAKNEKDKKIAIIIYLIINCGFRVGNKKYEKENNSYGVTTIKYKHITFENKKIIIDFIGKKGVRNVGYCDNKHIYKYLNDKKIEHRDDDYIFENIDSSDINSYLKTFSENITSKELRTWNANTIFINEALNNNINDAFKYVSQRLHNTVAVCKKHYIDPNIIKLVENKKMNIK